MADAADTTTTTTADTTQQTTAPATSWVDSLPDPVKGFAVNKGWKEPGQSVQSYIELERMVGADKAGRTVLLPGENATPEELAAFRGKLGVPTDATGYEIALPDGFPDPEFGKLGGGLLHKHGIPKANGEAFMADVIAQVQQGETDRAAAEQVEFAKQETALKTKWGPDYDKNTEIARRGMAKAGFSPELIDQIEAKAGFAGVMEAMHKLGMQLGEGNFVDDDASGGGGFGKSLDHLVAKRLALYSDAAWAARYHANDPAARNEAKAIEEEIAAARRKGS